MSLSVDVAMIDGEFGTTLHRLLDRDAALMRSLGATEDEVATFLEGQREVYAAAKDEAMAEIVKWLREGEANAKSTSHRDGWLQ